MTRQHDWQRYARWQGNMIKICKMTRQHDKDIQDDKATWLTEICMMSMYVAWSQDRIIICLQCDFVMMWVATV